MRIAFLKPPVGGILGLEMLTFVEPLGMECVAGVLEPDGHECRIFDLRIDGQEKGMERCVAFEPDIVGLQCNFTTERYRTVKLAQEVKRRLPEALVVVGGHDASRDPEWFGDEAIDAVAVGEGESVMPLLVRAAGNGRDLGKAPGLKLNTPGGPRYTGPAPDRMRMDDLPLPARHLIDEYREQYHISFRRPMALMETARGCPFRCNFCSVWKYHEKTFREKSPERVVEELAQIKAPNVFVADDIFWLDVKRGRRMADCIKASGIRKFFTVQTRTDIICKFPDLVEQWKDCGDLSVFMGLEKVDDKGLESLNKRNSASNNVRAIKILRDLDVGFCCNFIVDPEWEHDDFERLREWIDENVAYNSGFSILTPLPGTDLWSDTEDRLTSRDWELFDLVHTVLPTKLPLDEFYREYSRLWDWTLKVRYKYRGRLKLYLQILAGFATGMVGVSDLRKGMQVTRNFGKSETFLAGHPEKDRKARAHPVEQPT